MSYTKIAALVAGRVLPLAGRNSSGEAVVIEGGSEQGAGAFFKVTTAQSNNWCRVNTYYASGVQEETYHR